MSHFRHTSARRVRTFRRMPAKTANALLVLALGALAGAAFAPAALAARSQHAEVEPRLQLSGSHGYRVLVSARERTVTIGVTRGATERAGSSTTYVARGIAGPHGIHANFHQFGVVNLRFHPTAQAVRGLPPDCAGGDGGADTVPGYFTGTVDFHGEHRYTVVHARRVKGEVVVPPTERCPLVAGGADPLFENPGAVLPPAKTRMTLQAIDKDGTGGLIFAARREGKTGFFAERFGTVGRIGILSLAYALAPRKTFVTDSRVSFGSVRPPKPFVGSGTLKRGPGGKRTWSGSLAVTFPGQGRVSLTGSQFHTTLSRSFP